MGDLTHTKRWKQIYRIALTAGLAFISVLFVLWGFHNITPARADNSNLYIDGAGGQDILTCGTIETPCQTISYTLNTQASEGDSLLIAAGTYPENLEISHFTVTLRGGYTISGTQWLTDTGETIVDGGGLDRVFLLHWTNSTLENLTIKNGNAPSPQCWGSGIWVTNGTMTIRSAIITENGPCGNALEVNDDRGTGHLTLESTTISSNLENGINVYGPNASIQMQDVIVFNNYSPNNGGGIQVRVGGSATILDSQIYSNTAENFGGGIGVINGSVTVSNTMVLSNTANGAGGAGIAVEDGTLILDSSSVMYNNAPNGQSGAIDVRSTSAVTVTNSVIADNAARDHGGAATVDPNATLDMTNVLLSGNSATTNNANVFAINGNVSLMNTTIADNNPTGAQAVILWDGHLTMTNSIMWNNALSLQGDPPCPTCFTVTYSDVQGGYTGTGNIDADPLFVAADDYRLQMDSPCVDTGANHGAPAYDLNQVVRPQDGDDNGEAIVDMGAFEFFWYKIFIPLIIL